MNILQKPLLLLLVAIIGISAHLSAMEPRGQKRSAEEEALDLLANKRRLLSNTLLQAAKDGDIERVQLMLYFHADVNAMDRQGRTPLLLAVEYGHPKVVQVLLEAGANTAIQYAYTNGLTALGLAWQTIEDEHNETLKEQRIAIYTLLTPYCSNQVRLERNRQAFFAVN